MRNLETYNSAKIKDKFNYIIQNHVQLYHIKSVVIGYDNYLDLNRRVLTYLDGSVPYQCLHDLMSRFDLASPSFLLVYFCTRYRPSR